MSKPFFIWTMRRTGGTSLTDLLTDISEYRGIEHEPFNADKKLGRFIKSFQNGTKCEKIIKELDEIFLAKPLIKHCYEIFGKEFNSLLVQSIVKHDYKHLFLKREDEISRIISLYLAQQTSVWGPEQKKKKYDDIISGKDKLEPFSIEKMIDDYKWCRNITNQTQKMLTEKGKEFMLISFEDFYVGERDRRLENLYSLFDYLEFDKNKRDTFNTEIENSIFNSSQNSREILKYVPNYDEAVKELLKVK